VDKVASLDAVGEQLRLKQSACQQSESRLQQEQSVLKEAQAALEHERSAREEAQGQLQRERAALERVQATIKLRDDEITRLSCELVQEGVSYEDLRQASEEKDAIILELQQAATTARSSLESEKKEVKGESLFLYFACWPSSFGDPLLAKFMFLLPGLWTALGTLVTQA
jgi:chromosome segregation ATPase